MRRRIMIGLLLAAALLLLPAGVVVKRGPRQIQPNYWTTWTVWDVTVTAGHCARVDNVSANTGACNTAGYSEHIPVGYELYVMDIGGWVTSALNGATEFCEMDLIIGAAANWGDDAETATLTSIHTGTDSDLVAVGATSTTTVDSLIDPTEWYRLEINTRATDECTGPGAPWACCTAAGAGATCCNASQGVTFVMTGILRQTP